MSEPPVDLDAFRDFERAAHDRLAKTYHDAFSVVTERAIEPLLDAAQVGAGTRLLDVASGSRSRPGRRRQTRLSSLASFRSSSLAAMPG